MNNPRTCRKCGNPLTGRSDKLFCSDQCRAQQNNQKKQENEGEQLILKVNAILRKNRSILKSASPQGKTTVHKQVLESLGLDFRYFTFVYRTQKGSAYHFCYDYGYLLLADEKVLIVNFQPYMEK